MKTFNKILFVWMIVATLVDLLTIMTPDIKQATKQSAAIFGIINCAVMLLVYNRTWGKPEDDKAKKKP